MVCANCGFNRANIELAYFGKIVCDRCFCKIVERRISKTIKNNALVKKGDKIAVALSGGKDSSLVLKYLSDYAKHNTIEIFAIHINRGDSYSIGSEDFAKKLAKDAGVDFYSFGFDELGVSFKDLNKIKQSTGVNMCSVCGVLRRHLLNKKSKELGATKVATGHNLTDETQTYLMNMIRGDIKGFAPLGPISLPKRKGFVQRIKILRQIPENEVKKYVELNKISHLPNPCPCRVGSLRFNMLNVLDDIKKFRPGAEFSVCKAGDFISEKVRSDRALNICKICKEPSANEICRTCTYIELLKK